MPLYLGTIYHQKYLSYTTVFTYMLLDFKTEYNNTNDFINHHEQKYKDTQLEGIETILSNHTETIQQLITVQDDVISELDTDTTFNTDFNGNIFPENSEKTVEDFISLLIDTYDFAGFQFAHDLSKPSEKWNEFEKVIDGTIERVNMNVELPEDLFFLLVEQLNDTFNTS